MEEKKTGRKRKTQHYKVYVIPNKNSNVTCEQIAEKIIYNTYMKLLDSGKI
jgi:hypothetical protein